MEWCKLSVLVADTLGALIGLVGTLVWLVPVWRKASVANLEGKQEWLGDRLPAADRAVIRKAREVSARLHATAERTEIGPLRVGLVLLVVAFLLSFSAKIVALFGGPTCS